MILGTELDEFYKIEVFTTPRTSLLLKAKILTYKMEKENETKVKAVAMLFYRGDAVDFCILFFSCALGG